MSEINEKLQVFESIRDDFKLKGVIESDLPFLKYSKANKKGILLIHGSDASACNTRELGDLLFQKGYNVMSVLLEGHAQNSNLLYDGSVSWVDCYNSVVHYLDIFRKLNKQVFIAGSSFGGTLAYLLSIEYQDIIKGLISISAPSHAFRDFSGNNLWAHQVYLSIKTVETNINRVVLPTLVLHSADDKVVKVKQALFAFDNIASEYKKLVVYDNIGHSLGFGSNNLEVAKDIDLFIETYTNPRVVKFELDYKNAFSVSIAGEFNNWSAIESPMSLINGKWIIEFKLLPGDYQYKFVINGNNWVLDPKAEKVVTPRGSENSIKRVL